ncbi:MAG: dephospho-CoA kinase [Bacteroidia bacterium]
MLKVGITGNLGSGKSTIAAIFAQLGVPVYNADEEAKKLMVQNHQLLHEITEIFGTDAYLPNGELNRKHISKLAFSNKDLLLKLNAAVHPRLNKHFDDWVKKQPDNAPFLLKEAALLVEAGSYKQLDRLIVVTADEETLIQRGMQRDGSTREQIVERLKNQLPQDEKVKLADFVILNDNKQAVLPQVMHVFEKLSIG